VPVEPRTLHSKSKPAAKINIFDINVQKNGFLFFHAYSNDIGSVLGKWFFQGNIISCLPANISLNNKMQSGKYNGICS
jgi:hypothetical protein